MSKRAQKLKVTFILGENLIDRLCVDKKTTPAGFLKV